MKSHRFPNPTRGRTSRWARSVFGTSIACVCVSLLTPPHAPGQEQVTTAPEAAGTGPYIRVVEDDQTGVMRLDLAIKVFAPRSDSGRPAVALAGAVHIADPSFYALLQAFLDAQNLVLFEGVKPRGMGLDADSAAEIDPATRIRQTEASLRFLAIVLERYTRESGNPYPATLDQLMRDSDAGRMGAAEQIEQCLKDGWGHPIAYAVDESGAYSLVSYGADGQPGGEGDDADIAFAGQNPLTSAELSDDPGIQGRMARALGLVFQLDAMRYDRANFRNSDLTIDQVQKQAQAEGADATALFKMMDGSSFTGRMMKVMFRFIEANPRMQVVFKLLLMDMLRLVETEGLTNIPGAPRELGTLMKVLIENRNQVVVRDLQSALAEDTDASRDCIAIVYGAGHLADMERRIMTECDYQHAATFWMPAITVDPSQAGLSRQNLETMRGMLERMMPNL